MIRPSFSSAWAASQRIYDTINPSEKVATVIGGNVAMNINSRDPALRWVNNLTAVLVLAWAAAPSNSWSKDDSTNSPQAGGRTYAQNYKDMVLADCIATAYKSEPKAAQDAGSSASVLMDWTYFDLEQAPQAGRPLVDQFLARDYHNPLVESERQGVRFELLKCLDLYHSKELDSQVKQLVINPQHTYRQDNPPRPKKD